MICSYLKPTISLEAEQQFSLTSLEFVSESPQIFLILRSNSLLANQHFTAPARHGFLCGIQLVSLIERSAHDRLFW